jgi:hypothetical protein
MSQELGLVLDEVRALRMELKPAPATPFQKLLHVLEKLVIPVMLGVVAWIGNQAGTKISEGQLRLAEAQLRLAESGADDQKNEFRRSMQAKYIEIFYKDLNSGDAKSQLNAIRLVRLLDGELAENLLGLVAVTPGVSDAVASKAVEVSRDLEALRPLRGYKVGIYFYGDDPAGIAEANAMQARLKDAGFTGVVQMYPRDEAFFKSVNPPSSFEVRFEKGTEDEAAAVLLGVVQDPSSQAKWTKVPVGNVTSNFISIFVPRKG